MKAQTYFTGVRLVRKCGLECYQVIVRNVIAHEFMSQHAAECKASQYIRMFSK